MPSLLEDPWFAAKLDTVVSRYRHLWSEEQIQAFREAAAYKLATHPEARALLERERAASTEASGTRAKDGAAQRRRGAK